MWERKELIKYTGELPYDAFDGELTTCSFLRDICIHVRVSSGKERHQQRLCMRQILVCKVLFPFFLKVQFLNLHSRLLNQGLLYHFATTTKGIVIFLYGIRSRVLFSSLCSSHFSPISRTLLLLLSLFLLRQKWGQLCLIS